MRGVAGRRCTVGGRRPAGRGLVGREWTGRTSHVSWTMKNEQKLGREREDEGARNVPLRESLLMGPQTGWMSSRLGSLGVKKWERLGGGLGLEVFDLLTWPRVRSPIVPPSLFLYVPLL